MSDPSCMICGSMNSFDSNLDKRRTNLVYIFHNILEIPMHECWKYVSGVEGGLPLSFCIGCNDLVGNGLELLDKMTLIKGQLKGINFCLVNKVVGPGQRSAISERLKFDVRRFLNMPQVQEEREDGIGFLTAISSAAEDDDNEWESIQKDLEEEEENKNEEYDYSKFEEDLEQMEQQQFTPPENNPEEKCDTKPDVEDENENEEDNAEDDNFNNGLYPNVEIKEEIIKEESDEDPLDYAFDEEFQEEEVEEMMDPESIKEEEDEDQEYDETELTEEELREQEIEFMKANLTPKGEDENGEYPSDFEVYDENGLANYNSMSKRKASDGLVSANSVKRQRMSFKRNFFCLLCDTSFTGQLDLAEHYSEEHKNPTVWPCNQCNQEFNFKKNLYRHRLETHKNLPINAMSTNPKYRENAGPKPKKGKRGMIGLKKTYICVVCDEVFINGKLLGDHYSADHANTKEWVCTAQGGCGRSYSSKDSLYCHRKYIHKNLNIPTNNLKIRANSPVKIPRSLNNFEVKTEQNPYPTRAIKPLGIQKVYRGKKILSTLSRANPTTTTALKFPIRVSKSRTWSCVLCDKVYYRNGSLRNHYIKTHGKMTGKSDDWICPETECAKKCNSKEELQVHRKRSHVTVQSNSSPPPLPPVLANANRIDYNPNVFQCLEESCGKIFDTEGSLNAHRKFSHNLTFPSMKYATF